MAFSDRNILRFFENYPLLAPFMKRTLARAAGYSHLGNISGGHMWRVMAELSPLFLHDLMHDPEQIIIAYAERARVSQELIGQVLTIIRFRKRTIFYGYCQPPTLACITQNLHLFDMDSRPDVGRFRIKLPSVLGELYIYDPGNPDDNIYFDNIDMPALGCRTQMQGRSGETGRVNCWWGIFYNIPPPQ